MLALENVISGERLSRHLLAGDGKDGWTSDFARSLRSLRQLGIDLRPPTSLPDAIGGPQAFTVFMRDIGDPHTRLDRKNRR